MATTVDEKPGRAAHTALGTADDVLSDPGRVDVRGELAPHPRRVEPQLMRVPHEIIVRHVRTEVVSLEGNGHLERVGWRDNETGRIETHGIRHVFTMTGAVPGTHWLGGCLALDAKGFIKTGPDLSPEDLAAARWPLPRAPHLLETSLPGVFAIGDVRAGSLKRVASAVGEGPIAIAAVHQVLHE